MTISMLPNNGNASPDITKAMARLFPNAEAENPAHEGLLVREVLPKKIATALERNGMQYLKQVLSLTKEDFMKIDGIGERGLERIVKHLAL